MLNAKNRLSSFLLYLLITIVSWIIVIFNFLRMIVTLFSVNTDSVNMTTFTLTSILLTFYTLFILIKPSAKAFAPIIFLFLHLNSMDQSMLSYSFIAIHVIVMLLLNTGSKSLDTQNGYYYSSQSSNRSYGNNNDKLGDDENVFDAEYTTRD